MKALIIITEGMDPFILEDQSKKGYLPWFSEKIKRAKYHRLDCGLVPYETTNLNTAFCGVNPGKHGCFSYWDALVDGNMPRVLESGDVKVKRIWEWNELNDLKFNIMNIQLTYPPKSINGKMISYLMHQTTNASYPRDLLSKLAKQGIKYAHDVTLFYRGEPFDVFAKQAFRIAQYQLQTAMELAKDCDVMIVNLTLADRLSHFLWYELKNDQGLTNKRPYILEAYDFLDQACKQLENIGTDNLFVFSEIGFGELTEFVSINKYLEEAGFLHLDGDKNVDYNKSIAFESVQGSHGIMFRNDLIGKAGTSYSEAKEVIDYLKAIRFSDNSHVLEQVFHRDDIYQGEYTKLAPSLIVKPKDEKRPPLGDPRWASRVRRTSQSGWHRDKGFIVIDSQFNVPSLIKSISLQQIAPTIAYALGRESAKQCEMGPVFHETFK